MVTHAPLEKKRATTTTRWASTFWSPCFTICPPSAFRSRLDLSAFQRVKQLLGGKSFLLVVFCKYIIPELSEKTPACREKGWTWEAKAQHSGVWRTGAAHPSRAQADCFFLVFFFFLTFHTQCAPILPSRVQSLLERRARAPPQVRLHLREWSPQQAGR